MKTRTIAHRNKIALLAWDLKSLKVQVRWFTFTAEGGFVALKDWPGPQDKDRRAFETLLTKVREYCSKSNLSLWSY